MRLPKTALNFESPFTFRFVTVSQATPPRGFKLEGRVKEALKCKISLANHS